ncbi:hypothetical protein V8C35DRAFT_298420 [Trichoderma chlorosporum]
MSDSVNARLNFFKPGQDGSGDSYHSGTLEAFSRIYDTREVEINNLRNQGFTLDKNGFQLEAYESQLKGIKAYEDEARIAGYELEIKQLLEVYTKASCVKVMSKVVRLNTLEEAKVQAAENITNGKSIPKITPVHMIHVDQSEDGAKEAFERTLGEESKQWENHRWAIINVWRPIIERGDEIVRRDPLAVCDASTVERNDLKEVKAKPPSGLDRINLPHTRHDEGTTSKIWNLIYNERQKWYYAPDMTDDEVLMIKCYDSDCLCEARQTPHSAFEIPGQPRNPVRRSIEVRCLVSWNKDLASPTV